MDRYFVWRHPTRRLFPWTVTQEARVSVGGKEYPIWRRCVSARRTRASAERLARRLVARQVAKQAAEAAEREAEDRIRAARA